MRCIIRPVVIAVMVSAGVGGVTGFAAWRHSPVGESSHGGAEWVTPVAVFGAWFGLSFVVVMAIVFAWRGLRSVVR